MTTKKRTKRAPKRKPDGARASALAVLGFINSKAPDFLSGLVQKAVDDACDHVGFARLMYEPGLESSDLTILTNLVRRTRMLEIAELEKSKVALARHIAAIYRHPLTPVHLYNAIGDFVTSGASMKISACEVKSDSLVNTDSDINLLEEWTWQPQTLQRIIDVYNVYDSKD